MKKDCFLVDKGVKGWHTRICNLQETWCVISQMPFVHQEFKHFAFVRFFDLRRLLWGVRLSLWRLTTCFNYKAIVWELGFKNGVLGTGEMAQQLRVLSWLCWLRTISNSSSRCTQWLLAPLGSSHTRSDTQTYIHAGKTPEAIAVKQTRQCFRYVSAGCVD